MSLTNAISAIAVVGSIVVAGKQESTLSTVLGTVAVTASMINIVGGYLITYRMLAMFKKGGREEMTSIEQVIQVVYILSAACFILALNWLSAVPTARRGVLDGVLGMALAVGGTLLRPEIVHYQWIAVAFVIGTVIGVPMA